MRAPRGNLRGAFGGSFARHWYLKSFSRRNSQVSAATKLKPAELDHMFGMFPGDGSTTQTFLCDYLNILLY